MTLDPESRNPVVYSRPKTNVRFLVSFFSCLYVFVCVRVNIYVCHDGEEIFYTCGVGVGNDGYDVTRSRVKEK